MGLKEWWTGGESQSLDDKVAAKSNSQQQYTPPPQPFTAYAPQQPLDNEQNQKWSDFFSTKWQELGDPTYRQLQVMVDAMAGVPSSTSYPICFAGLKASGVTKSALLNGAQRTLDAFKQNALEYMKTRDTKRQAEVDAIRQQSLDKQAQMQKLSQEIIELNATANNAEAKINLSILGYNTYSAQALTKISNDLQSITNFIPE